MTANSVGKSINRIIHHLVHVGLADDQNYASVRQLGGGIAQVTFGTGNAVSIGLKNLDYRVVHRELSTARAFTVKMLDGALIQMMYEFHRKAVRKHRLAFFPAPQLDEFQKSPTVYMEDEVFGDVVAEEKVPFPVRFDYNSEDSSHSPILHPKSHLTLGEYPECRIPVSAPLTPGHFVDFLLRNFYDTAARRYADELPGDRGSFAECIDAKERDVLHVVVPA